MPLDTPQYKPWAFPRTTHTSFSEMREALQAMGIDPETVYRVDWIQQKPDPSFWE